MRAELIVVLTRKSALVQQRYTCVMPYSIFYAKNVQEVHIWINYYPGLNILLAKSNFGYISNLWKEVVEMSVRKCVTLGYAKCPQLIQQRHIQRLFNIIFLQLRIIKVKSYSGLKIFNYSSLFFTLVSWNSVIYFYFFRKIWYTERSNVGWKFLSFKIYFLFGCHKNYFRAQ